MTSPTAEERQPGRALEIPTASRRNRRRIRSARSGFKFRRQLPESDCCGAAASQNLYVDAVAGVRRHSMAASAPNRRVATNSPTTIIRSTDPSCWSGSQPDTNSIQSGKTGVMRANRPVIAANPISIQNRGRIFRRIRSSSSTRPSSPLWQPCSALNDPRHRHRHRRHSTGSLVGSSDACRSICRGNRRNRPCGFRRTPLCSRRPRSYTPAPRRISPA